MRGRRSSIALVLLALVTAGVMASVLGHAGERGLGAELVIGIVTSLLGSFILIAARLMSAGEPRQSMTEPHIAGLIKLTTKERIDSNEWLRLLEKAQDEFYIAGHSLGKWCSASNARVFKGEVKRITGQRGHVTLVMLDPDSEQIRRLQRATSVDYTGKIESSRTVLGQLWAELPADARRYLRVVMLPDHLSLPYMVAGNENTLITATYPSNSDSNGVPCAVLNRTSEAAAAVYDDFSQLADSGLPVPIETATPSLESPPAMRRRSWKLWSK